MIGNHNETFQIEAGHSAHVFILKMQAAQPESFQDILADFGIWGNNRGTEVVGQLDRTIWRSGKLTAPQIQLLSQLNTRSLLLCLTFVGVILMKQRTTK